ncbi:acyl-CoA dehydrogenase family protein [Streptomyces leeuwenhoekii]|uniref:Flavin-dependent monooxygenase, oxygenase subunit n=1 Tax=Streptomyces leeuwenhoekii TaxID=1437453 RepID=A0A0F7VYZ0_STRLW|nr:acyl-CoA dehydrogenase family protein [Streptomyces leeuwenhoekii]CQR65739.1 Flavin-dependent monooxygenase, oxygenase subunit [Streptomyces leeuwenhoekii]
MTAVTGERAGETTGPAVGPAELVARARELAPLIREHAVKTEQDRRLAEEVVVALREAGMFRLTTPARFGGYELRMPDLISIIVEVGKACGSAGWNLSIDTASTRFALNAMPETALSDMFEGNPDAYVISTAHLSTTKAYRAEGGYRVTGTFPWSSGCEIADWAYIPVVHVHDGDEQTADLVGVVVPMSELRIERTWHSAGLAGSGTHTVVAEDVFVPERRATAFSLTDLVGEDERDSMLIQGSVQSLAAIVGAAQGAVEVTRQALDKKRPITYVNYAAAADAPSVQMWFAEATHLIETAQLHLREIGTALDGVPETQPMPWLERARLRMHERSAQEKSRAGVEKLLDVVGGSAFALSNPLQRLWRDISVMSRHTALNAPIIVEDYSRAVLDVHPSVTLLY